MPKQKGGGSIGQSLHYVDPNAPERSASAGGDLLKATPFIARPAIGGGGTRKKNRHGGFYPSVMAGVVDNALLVGPLAAFAGRKLLSRKSRRGGGKKGNIWKAQQQEAKAALGAIPHAKPTAQNISKYAAAKRMGSIQAEEFFDAFRKRVQEKQEALEAVKQSRRQAREAKKVLKKTSRNAEKEAKAMEKAAAKAIKEAEKAAKKAAKQVAKEATKKNKVPRAKKGTKKSERPPSALQLKRMAEANSAAAKAAMKETLKNGQSAWQNLIQEAKTRLATEGKATLKDAMQLASLMKEKKNTTAFLNEFRARPQKTKKRTARSTTTTVAPQTTKKVTVKATNKPKRAASESQQAYFKALSNARTFLGTVGAPLGPNMSKYASMVVQKAKETDSEKRKALEKTMNNWVEEFKTRRPLSMAKAPKTTKAKTPKKPLTVVIENNTNTENSMQGYSENFEPEPETNKSEK